VPARFASARSRSKPRRAQRLPAMVSDTLVKNQSAPRPLRHFRALARLCSTPREPGDCLDCPLSSAFDGRRSRNRMEWRWVVARAYSASCSFCSRAASAVAAFCYTAAVSELTAALGQRPEDAADVLQGQGVPEAPAPQSDAVQDRQGLARRTGQATIRPKTVRIRWSDQARLPQEGEDDEEGRLAARVHVVQVQASARPQALQALRARR